MTTPDNPLIDAARGRDEKPSLLPCPFCGGTPTATGPWEIGTSDRFEACIECLHCGYHLSSHDGTLFDKSKALRIATEKWNRRASMEGCRIQAKASKDCQRPECMSHGCFGHCMKDST